MTVILAPGQGSQKPGMLQAWLEIPELSSCIDRFSEISNLDLRYLGTKASADEITHTEIAQPLIVTAGIVSFRYAQSLGITFPSSTIIAGHSIGEITAAAVAGIISDNDALTLAAARGSLMAHACKDGSTSMVALLGGDQESVIAAIHNNNLTAANFNAKGQIVAAGAVENIARLIENPPDGTRIRQLAVAGAFHSPYMSDAQTSFARTVSSVRVNNPHYRLLTNKDGSICTFGEDFVQFLVDQMTSPVQWYECLQTINTEAPSATVIELAPAGTLLAIAKRELKDTVKVSFNTPEDVQNFAHVNV